MMEVLEDKTKTVNKKQTKIKQKEKPKIPSPEGCMVKKIKIRSDDKQKVHCSLATKWFIIQLCDNHVAKKESLNVLSDTRLPDFSRVEIFYLLSPAS